MSGNTELDQKIQEWLTWDRNPNTLEEIRKLSDEGNYDRLREILVNRISFGTAGLRGRMGAGFFCMNELVVVQTAQGLLRHLELHEPGLLKSKGIVVGYDGRHNSKRFAELTAGIFLNKNYPVHLFSKMVPTPFIPFSVNQLGTAAGVMVTASHNPKEDNGYKVYGSNGCQIISPTDKSIQKFILENLEPWDGSWDTEILKNSTFLTDPFQNMFDKYLEIISDQIGDDNKQGNAGSNLKFTYTAMHGVGYDFIVELFKRNNLHVIPVKEQIDPDPDFPTVKFPNPEEGKSALDLAIKTADREGSTIILANDPDGDRLAVAEKDLSTGQWKVFTGNELGAILGLWCLNCYNAKNPTVYNLRNCYFLSSTVSSKILKTIAPTEGMNFIETLTGFKWMGNKARELLDEGKEVLFAFEEAIGFMCGTAVLDKDGISAALHVATCATFLHDIYMTLNQELEQTYRDFGFHISENSYFICHDQEKIKQIFDRLRNFNGPNTYPSAILKDKYKIQSIRDLTTGYDNSQPDNKAILPVSKSSEMITFSFENGLVATLRTSGTEPKIKYYTELVAPPSQTNREEIENTLKEMVEGLVEEFLQPTKNGLVPKSD